MIPDQYFKQAIAQITLNTSTSADYCYSLSMSDFIEFYEDLSNEAERMRKAGENKNG